MTRFLRRHRRHGVGKGLRRPIARRLHATVALVGAVLGSAALAQGAAAQVWTTNLVQLDQGVCGRNLQVGSDTTASASNMPTFRLMGDGPASAYQVFIDGFYLGVFGANTYSNVCITTTTPLADGPHVLTANELTPRPEMVVAPFAFSVDTVRPSAPSTPVLSTYSDSGIVGDGITKARSATFTGTADPNAGVQLYSNLSGGGGGTSDSTGFWSVTTAPLMAGTQTIVAASLDSAGNVSPILPGVSVTIDFTAPATPPAPVLDLASDTAPVGDNATTVTNPVVTGTVATDVWKVFVYRNGLQVGTATPDQTGTWRFTLPAMSNGTYGITVRTNDLADNQTPLSGSLSLIIGPPPVQTVPGAPTLNSAAGGAGSVALGWSAPASNGYSTITGYRVYRGTASGGETLLTTLGAVTSWTDTSVTAGTTYYYQVSAVNGIGEGSRSNERSATPSAPVAVPGAPTLATLTPGSNRVTLSWIAPLFDGGTAITGYRVYRGTSSGNLLLLASVGTVSSYTDFTATNGTKFYYQVSAVNAAGESARSNEGFATPMTWPGAPSLTSATGGNASVALAWTPPASTGGSAITGYRIYRGTSSAFIPLLTTVGNVTSYVDTLVSNGTTYYYEISAVNAVGEGEVSNRKAGTPTASVSVPGAPTLNSATAGNGSVTLGWGAPASDGGSAVTGYKVYRGTTSGSGSLVATVGALMSWTDASAVNGTTYFYRVSAVNAVGEGSQSNERSATPVAPATVPGAPTLDSASAGNASVTLGWTAPSSNGGSAVTGYKVYRGTSSGSGSLLATLGVVTGWTDSSAVNGTMYFYSVSAVNAVGEGARSNERSATPVAPATVPGAPTLGSATAGNGSVALAWSAPSSNGGSAVTGYKVYRGTSSGSGSLLATLGLVTGWTDASAVNGTTYFYRVSAVNAVGEGSQSNERSATPVAPATVPGAPTLDSASAGNASVTLGWTAPSSNGGSAVTGYRIYRGTTSGGATLLATVGAVTGWTDASAVNGTTYFYRVSAVNAVGEGSQSNERSATPTAPATVPGAPTLSSATAGNGSVALAWSAPSSNGGSAVTGYRVYRGTTSGGATLLTTLGVVTGWTDITVSNGTTYYYQVSAVNSVGEGTRSNERATTPVTVPGAPTLNAATAGDGSVSLGWSAPASNGGSTVTGYKVYRGTFSGGGSLLATLGVVTGYVDSTAANGTTYFYRVAALNAVGEGSQSNERSATPTASATVPGAPTLATITAGNATVNLSWVAPLFDGGASITAYRVYRGTSSGSVTLLTTLGAVSNWTDTSVFNGTTYYYQVSAVNTVGEGTRSNQGSATPSTAPSDPTLSSATAGNGSVSLGWNAPASSGGSTVTGYKVYRGTSSGSLSLLVTVGLVSGYFDGSVANGTTYFYRVSAVNAVGEGPQSNERSATPSEPATVPGAPSLDSATAGSGSVTLAWSAPSSNGGSAITGYRVYRGTASGSGSLLATVGAVTGYTDASAVNGTTYFYRVRAVNSVGEGAQSNERSATPTAAATVPGAPTLSSATAGNASVALAWSAPSSNGGSAVTGYRVYRGTSSGGGSLLATLGVLSGWTDTTAANGTTYYYRVSAVNSVGEGAQSNERSATPAAPATAPGAPTLSSATAGNASVALAWGAPSSNGGSAIASYRIYRGTSSGGAVFLTTVGVVTSWTDPTPANGITYYYQVSAVNSVGEGARSNERSATPAAPSTVPGAPTLNSASPAPGSVTLAWSAPASNGGSAITGYRVYRGTWSGGETFLASVGAVTSWTDTAAANGTTYFYQVSAVNSLGEGLRSNERSAATVAPGDTTAPSSPASLKALALGTTQVVLDWLASTDNVGVTGYQVYRGGVLVATVTTSHALVSGLTPNTSYSFYVRAVDAAGNQSVASSTITAKTAAVGTSSTGTLSGVVFDTNGALLANVVASVTVSGSVKTNKTRSGVWKLSSIPPGTYTVTFTLSGYQTRTATMIVIKGHTVLSAVELPR